MSTISASTFSAMLKKNQLQLWVRYYGKMVKFSGSMKSLHNFQRTRDLTPHEALRNLGDGVVKLSQRSTDTDSSLQARMNAGKKTEDDRFHTLMNCIRNRTTRERLGLTYLCSAALIRDAIGKGVLFPEIYFHSSIDVKALLPKQLLIDTGVEFVPVSKESFTKHLNAELGTDGLCAVFAKPCRQRLSKNPSAEPLPVTVICDNIRDPGNMGKIIQSSVAISCDRILVTKGCVDVWDPKVLQMGRGAHFDALIEMNLDWQEIGEILPTDCRIYMADSLDEKDKRQAKETGACILEYDSIDYCHGHHAVVVIGGETTGISGQADALSRTKKQPGQRIHVPMMSGIDSLNSAVAGSIILFEIGRQMKLRSHKY